MGNKIIQIEVQDDRKATIKMIGPTGTVGCISLALSPPGILYSMCGPGAAISGPQQLATIDPETGHANLFGVTIMGLTVMGLKFGPDGSLYAVADSKADSPTFNSLYTVDQKTGAFTRIGSTGAPSFFMDFTFDRAGTMYGATNEALYRIDVKTGAARKVADFMGSSDIMGLAFNRGATKLYATDFKEPSSDLYLVDATSGSLKPITKIGYANSHNLVLAGR